MSDLRKVAFVAMPFNTKETGVAPGKGPATIDFDALWNNAIFPALDDLHYYPIRADMQSGSVIIKDMLDQLVHADLVLADITIPNGNVYYEAGVRHAAKAQGCILINADWSRPLFDLGQITQLRYPLERESPSAEDYLAIKTLLINSIPALSDSVGPVYELTQIAKGDSVDARVLREVKEKLFEFETELRAARIKAEGGDKQALRDLVADKRIEQLPNYAIVDLVRIVRDNLEWHELADVLKRWPTLVQEDAYLSEQKALAIGKMGQLADAIALLEEIVRRHGETPGRLGTVAGRYRELIRKTPNPTLKRQYLTKAIEAYRRGMLLDLNRYYCAHKLVVTLVERNRKGGRAEAQRCADLVLVACKRVTAMNQADEWLDSTLLIHAFFSQDLDRALEASERILDRGWANWKILGLFRDLESILATIKKPSLQPFEKIMSEISRALPKSQAELMSMLGAKMAAAQRYKKAKGVFARHAVEGEVVNSITADGQETTNQAKVGEMVVRNETDAKELYIVGSEKFQQRYDSINEEPVDGMRRYGPKGKVKALVITHEITTKMDVGTDFFIMANWGTEQLAREGDYFVSPLPELNEIYRIARSEFDQTYVCDESERDGN